MQILFVAGLLLGANWLLFIWAINNDHILGVPWLLHQPSYQRIFRATFLGERLRNLQRVAVGLAVIGVAILIFFTATCRIARCLREVLACTAYCASKWQ